MDTNSFSSEGQEQFVLDILENKKNGYYVEVGAWHSKDKSNTYLLENVYNWKGVALEIEKERADEYNLNRKNPCINADAIRFDYYKYFKENDFPKQIDYLQIDIDHTPWDANLLALLAMPLNQYRFTVVTLEHNLINDIRFEELRKAQRYVMRSLDYKLMVKDPCEDWWVDRYAFSDKYLQPFMRGAY